MMFDRITAEQNIVHNLASRQISVEQYEQGNPHRDVVADYDILDDNTIRLRYDATQAWIVAVVHRLGKFGIELPRIVKPLAPIPLTEGVVYFDEDRDKLLQWTEIEPPRYYKHFKGEHGSDPLFGIYKLLSDNAMMHDGPDGQERQRFVVYSHITDPKRTYIRPYENFYEEVMERSPQPYYVPRFRLLTPPELIELGLM